MKVCKKVLMYFVVLCLSMVCLNPLSVFAEDISILSITKTYGDGPFSVQFSTNSNGKVTYSSSNKKVATVSSKGKVTIKGCGKTDIKIKIASTKKYKAKTGKFTVIVKPKKQNITYIKDDKRNITVKWNKDTKADGYYIYYSTDYKFSNDLHKVNVSKNKTISKTIKNLKMNKKYYVKVCSYKKSGKDMISGDFSKIFSVNIKE